MWRITGAQGTGCILQNERLSQLGLQREFKHKVHQNPSRDRRSLLPYNGDRQDGVLRIILIRLHLGRHFGLGDFDRKTFSCLLKGEQFGGKSDFVGGTPDLSTTGERQDQRNLHMTSRRRLGKPQIQSDGSTRRGRFILGRRRSGHRSHTKEHPND